jgi:hypothetical protein
VTSTHIGEQAFAGCDGLTSVAIPNSVISLGPGAFDDCFNLASVTIGSDVTDIGTNAFEGDYATVYYLPGTSGWDSMFDGLPAVPVSLQVETGDSGLGVQNNQFCFNVNRVSGAAVIVETCTNLANPVWAPIQMNSTPFYFSDPRRTNYPGRFYLLCAPSG